MKLLAPVVFATLALTLMSSEASAWYCRAIGYGGTGWGRSPSLARARHLALYQCALSGMQCRIRACVY
jgi:hypothetical protein